ncbi:hypothetical protein CAL7102_02492 [Dulcicalothrix desertica PCC 7102]|nr:hypothetical protein CAL7102_02492 [Dulcicalothrix desertica PCC 7102]
MSEIQIGSVIKLIRGAFKDFEGVVSDFTNKGIVVDLDIFARNNSLTTSRTIVFFPYFPQL